MPATIEDFVKRFTGAGARDDQATSQEHVQSQPWLLKTMGNPFVTGALRVVASKLLRRR